MTEYELVCLIATLCTTVEVKIDKDRTRAVDLQKIVFEHKNKLEYALQLAKQAEELLKHHNQ